MRLRERLRQKLFPYVTSVGLVALITAIGNSIKTTIEPTNLVMLYLLVVVIAAALWGKGPATVTSFLAVLCFDFFLVPPYLNFNVDSIHYVFTFVGLLAVGLMISTLASRMRARAIEARNREVQTAALYRMSVELANAGTFESALEAIRNTARDAFECDAAIFLPAGEHLEAKSVDPDFPLSPREMRAATQTLRNATFDERQRPVAPARTRYIAIQTQHAVLGVLGLSFGDESRRLTVAQESLLHALTMQAASAIQRAKLSEDARQIELMRQTEKLQSALLSSISHDLRTPLTSIMGTLTALLGAGSGLDDATRRELIETACREAGRLDRLVGNLLDMTKMEAGTPRISKRPCELRDVLGASLEQLRGEADGRSVRIRVPQNLPEVPMDFTSMMKVFFNLIENALKYTPAGSPIEIAAQAIRDTVEIEIRDSGPGVAENDLARLFERFYRAGADRHVGGTGLGLAICRGIVEAHGGVIAARNNASKGMTFTIILPLV